MKRLIKKAFTLVELLVVIAILAVLATVAIVGYSSFTEKARLSNDQSMITQINYQLKADNVDGHYTYASDAIDMLYKNGWNAGKIEPYSNGYHYAYSMEQNMMFLLDESNTVVYPESVNVDLSSLWGFYSDAVEGHVTGINKYIAMKNVTNAQNLEQAFGSSPCTIDLNGYYFGIEGNHSNITIINGGLVKGTVTTIDETIKEYEKVENNAIQTGVVYENKIFENMDGAHSYIELKNVTFKNCVFYDCEVRTNNAHGYVKFEGCTFNGGFNSGANGNAAIEIYHDHTDFTLCEITNCTFDHVIRGINITSACTTAKSIKISGCTFNGATAPKYLIQLASNRYIDTIVIENNNFESLGSAVTIFRFHAGFTGFGSTSSLDNLTFNNNTVSSSIPKSKYMDVDGTNNATFLAEALKKFK